MKLRICTEDIGCQIGPSFVINNLDLLQVETYKYLGVLLDVNLNFQSQHKKVVANVQGKLSHFRRIRYYLKKSCHSDLQVYNSAIIGICRLYL